jgi:hypothetical protein
VSIEGIHDLEEGVILGKVEIEKVKGIDSTQEIMRERVHLLRECGEELADMDIGSRWDWKKLLPCEESIWGAFESLDPLEEEK